MSSNEERLPVKVDMLDGGEPAVEVRASIKGCFKAIMWMTGVTVAFWGALAFVCVTLYNALF